MQEESSPASTVFLAWLMCQPTGLRLIAANTSAALVVPPLQTLRHLLVEADTYGDAAVAAVCQLRGLQTLRLASKDNTMCVKTCINLTGAACAQCSTLRDVKGVHAQRKLLMLIT